MKLELVQRYVDLGQVPNNREDSLWSCCDGWIDVRQSGGKGLNRVVNRSD